MNRIRSSVRGLLGTALTLALLATTQSACSSPSPSSPPPRPAQESGIQGDFAGLVDVGGGRKVFLECHGSGSPTVVLQSGFGNAADIWSVTRDRPPAVAPRLAQFTRVCAYDRPGSTRILTDDGSVAQTPLPGRSDPAPMPRTAADVAAELHTLLANAGVPGPYVLVGHSIGGLFALLYARTYPDEVAGLVLVDATPPPMRQLLPARQWDEFERTVLHPDSQVPNYPVEAYDLSASLDQIDAAPPLPRVPAVLLVATKFDPLPDPPPPGFPVEALAAVTRLKPEADARFAASVPGARLVPVPDTTHYIQVDRPDIVVETIRTVTS